MAWLRHLQFPHAPLKWPAIHRHSINNASPKGRAYMIQDDAAICPWDYIKMPLMYNDRCIKICAPVMLSCTNKIFCPERVRTFHWRLLCIRGASNYYSAIDRIEYECWKISKINKTAWWAVCNAWALHTHIWY